MSEFVAGAFVDVHPDAKGFRGEVVRQVNAQIKKPIPIPVELDPKRFKSTVANAARQTKAAVPITISTSIVDLRKQITDKISSASKGVKIRVPIQVEEAKGTKGAATRAANAASGGGGTTRSAGRQITEDERASKVKAALKRANEQLLISERALARAAEPNISAAERTARATEARSAASRADKAVNDVLAISAGKLAADEEAALEVSSKAATVRREASVLKRKEISDNTAVAKAHKQAADAETRAIEVRSRDIKSIHDLNSLKKLENDLTSADAELKRRAARATDLGLGSTATSLENRRKDLSLMQLQIDERRKFIKGETSLQRQQKTVARGFGATALSMIGIRGATLAASNAFLIGAASAALFAKAVQSFAALETELNVFQATTGATADEMRQVSDLAKALGADIRLPGVSAGDAAQSMTELARAGLSVRDSMAAARGVLQLASAAQISFAEAADLTASALNAFGLEGEDAIRVADLLANAANASQGSISEMAAALAQASAIARQVGLTVGNTVAILTQFARNGLRGSDAGTSLRTALSRLIAPTKKAGDLMAALGLHTRDAAGNLRPDIFVQFGQATANLSPELRDMIAQTIAGQDAIRAFSIGAREGARGLKLAQLQMAQTGSAAKLAAARSKGLAGQLSALGNSAQTLGGQLGKFAAGPVSVTVGALNDLLGVLNKLASGNFGDLFGDKSTQQAFANLKQRATGLKDIFTNLPGSAGANKGLKELFSFAPAVDKDQKRINDLLETLDRLQSLRVNAFKVGSDIAPITSEIQRIRKELHNAQVDAGLIIPVTKLEKQLFPLKQARKEAVDLRDEILKTGGSPTETRFLDDLIRNFDARIKLTTKTARQAAKNLKNATAKELSGLDIAKSFEAQFKLLAGNIDLATPDVLNGLNNLARKIKGAAPVTGAAGQEVGKRLIENINKAIVAAVENDDPDTAAALKKLAEKIAKLFGLNLGEAFKNIKVPLTEQELTDALLPQRIKSARAEAFGTVGEQIAAKQAELDALIKQLQTVDKGSAREEKILNDIAAKKQEIRSLRESQASDQKEKDKNSAQRIVDAISGKEQVLLNKLTIAQGDESVKNDIKARIALRNFYTEQIAVVKATVRDAETRRDQIDALEQKRFQIEQDITADRRTRREQIRDRGLSKIDDADERAQETETLADNLRVAKRRVRFWRRQVANLRALVRERKATADELKAARTSLDDAEDQAVAATKSRRQQKREQKQSIIESDIEFANITGNKSAEIAARKRFIAFLEGQKKFFKGNVLKLKELRNEIASQNKAIKDLKGEAENGSATSLADLFTQQVSIAKQAGIDVPAQIPGNVTQPIEDEVTRRLRMRFDPSIAMGGPPTQADRNTQKQVESNAELVAALNRLALVFSGRGIGSPNQTTNDQRAAVVGARYNAMARFWRAHKNRNMHEETAGA